MLLLLIKLFVSVSFADSSHWMEIKSTDGKVQTFIHQPPRKQIETEKPSFLSIYQIPKDSENLKVMAEIKRDAKIILDLAPANCYETDSQEPGIKQTWCENEKPFFTVVVEGGKTLMKENERSRHILASVVGIGVLK